VLLALLLSQEGVFTVVHFVYFM